MVDTSIPLPFSVDVDMKQITLEKGQTSQVILTVTKADGSVGESIDVSVNGNLTSTFSDILLDTELSSFSLSNDITFIPVEIIVNEHALSGTHKILLGVYTDDVAVSEFITVTIV